MLRTRHAPATHGTRVPIAARFRIAADAYTMHVLHASQAPAALATIQHVCVHCPSSDFAHMYLRVYTHRNTRAHAHRCTNACMGASVHACAPASTCARADAHRWDDDDDFLSSAIELADSLSAQHTLGQDRSTSGQDQSTSGQDRSTSGQHRSTSCQDRSTLNQDRSMYGQDRFTSGPDWPPNQSISFQDGPTAGQGTGLCVWDGGGGDSDHSDCEWLDAE